MARTYTRAEIRTRVLFVVDMVGGSSAFAGTSGVDDLINVHAAWVYSRLVKRNPDHYASGSLTLTASSTALPSDHFLTVDVLVNESGGRQRPLNEATGRDLYRVIPATGTISCALIYVPRLAIIATGAGSDSTTFDGVNGYEELIALRTARDLLMKEKTGVDVIQQQIAEYEQELATAPKRNRTGPIPINDVERVDAWPFASLLTHYRQLGGNVLLYQSAYPYA